MSCRIEYTHIFLSNYLKQKFYNFFLKTHLHIGICQFIIGNLQFSCRTDPILKKNFQLLSIHVIEEK